MSPDRFPRVSVATAAPELAPTEKQRYFAELVLFLALVGKRPANRPRRPSRPTAHVQRSARARVRSTYLKELSS